MARKPRLFVGGCPQHIIQRGNNRSVCFFADADYAFYMKKLKESADHFDVQVHAYALMTNHAHLLVTGADSSSIPNMMQALGRSYVGYVNTTYRRSGTLWEGRYRSSLVSSRQYYLTLSRYIEMNPVRANMVSVPSEYPWSSFRHNGMGITIAVISEHGEYLALGQTRSARIQNYRKLFECELSQDVIAEIRQCTNKGWIIGNEKFKREIEEALNRKLPDHEWGGDRKSRDFKDQGV